MSKQQRILVVEDEADLRAMYRLALALEGFSVEEAGDAPEALRRLDHYPPNLIVLDLGLPTLGGVAILQEIAAHAFTRHIPVVVVTGSAMPLDHLDVPCVLRKPITPDELLKAVRECLKNGAPGIGS